MRRKSSGFSMIEVLVSLVILLLGLLGLSSLQAKAQHAEFESYQRTQALVLLNDMADRINRNRGTAPCYAVTTASGTPHLGTANSNTPSCTGIGTGDSRELALEDMDEWQSLLLGAAETVGGSNAGAMIGARGCVARDNPNALTDIYTIAVAWQGRNDTAPPAAPAGASTATQNAIACGANQYGDETKRRVVWTTVRIAKLQ
jgi:type IV pilus assembly protein PilV